MDRKDVSRVTRAVSWVTKMVSLVARTVTPVVMTVPSVTVPDCRQSLEAASIALNIDFQKHHTIFRQRLL